MNRLTIEQRLDALQAALRQADVQRRIGDVRSFHWLVQCRIEDVTVMTNSLLERIDELLDCQRSGTHILGKASSRMLLALWSRGQTATIAAGVTEGNEFIDLVVLGSGGSLAYRWTENGDGTL